MIARFTRAVPLRYEIAPLAVVVPDLDSDADADFEPKGLYPSIQTSFLSSRIE